jgi:hypothetical protein
VLPGNTAGAVGQRPVRTVVAADSEFALATQSGGQDRLFGECRLVPDRQFQQGFGERAGDDAGSVVVGLLAVSRQFDPDQVVADHQSLAVLQRMRAGQPGRAAFEESTIGRQVVKQVSLLQAPDFAMAAREYPPGVGQCPLQPLQSPQPDALAVTKIDTGRNGCRQTSGVSKRQAKLHE